MTRGPEFFSYDNGVPKNRLGLDDAEALSLIEQDLAFNRALEIKNGTAPEATRSGEFDLEHLRAIHQHLFQDVYEWAGTTRNQTMSIEGQQVRAAPLIYKDDGRVPVPFVPSTQVDRSLSQTLGQLREQNFLQGLPRPEFADRAAVVFSEINSAHPFMEGNGRTQREFMTQLAKQAGHSLTFDVVSAERMSVVSLEARMGDVSGMQRLFQEISNPDRVALLAKAQDFLDREKQNWQGMYVASATPGQDYTARAAITSPELVVLRSEGDVIVAQTRDIDPEALQAGGEIKFTATEYGPRDGDAPEHARARNLDFEF